MISRMQYNNNKISIHRDCATILSIPLRFHLIRQFQHKLANRMLFLSLRRHLLIQLSSAMAAELTMPISSLNRKPSRSICTIHRFCLHQQLMDGSLILSFSDTNTIYILSYCMRSCTKSRISRAYWRFVMRISFPFKMVRLLLIKTSFSIRRSISSSWKINTTVPAGFLHPGNGRTSPHGTDCSPSAAVESPLH